MLYRKPCILRVYSRFPPGVLITAIDISYTPDSASAYQKVKPKISAVTLHNNRRRPYWSFPLIEKNATENTILFCICVLNPFKLHKRGFIVNFVHFRNTKYTNYHAPYQLRENDQRLRSGFNFRLPTVWDAPSSVYEISVVTAHRESSQDGLADTSPCGKAGKKCIIHACM